MPPSRPGARREETVVKMINQNHYTPGLDKTKKVDSRVWDPHKHTHTHTHLIAEEQSLIREGPKCEEMQSLESGGCLIFERSRTLYNTVGTEDSVASGCSEVEIYYKFLARTEQYICQWLFITFLCILHIWKQKRIYCLYHLHKIGLTYFLGFCCCFIPFKKQHSL